MRLVECSKFRSQAAIVCLVWNYGNGMRLLSIVVHRAATVMRVRYGVTYVQPSVQENWRTVWRLQRSENVAVEMTCTITVLLVAMLMVDVTMVMIMITAVR